jgi:hypothetical protein
MINADDLSIPSRQIAQQNRNITRAATHVQDSHPFSDARVDQQTRGEVESVDRHC